MHEETNPYRSRPHFKNTACRIPHILLLKIMYILDPTYSWLAEKEENSLEFCQMRISISPVTRLRMK